MIINAMGGPGHRSGELNALACLGHLHRTLHRHGRATEHFGQALQIAQTTGDRSGGLNPLTGLGHVYLAQHDYEQAATYYRQTLDLAGEPAIRHDPN